MVVLVARPSTEEAFAISAIENSSVYLAKRSHLASAYHGILYMQPIGLFLFPPGWDPCLLQGYSLALHSPYTGVDRSSVESKCIAQSATQWFCPWCKPLRCIGSQNKRFNRAQDIQLVIADLWLWSTQFLKKMDYYMIFLFVLSFPLQYLTNFPFVGSKLHT